MIVRNITRCKTKLVYLRMAKAINLSVGPEVKAYDSNDSKEEPFLRNPMSKQKWPSAKGNIGVEAAASKSPTMR